MATNNSINAPLPLAVSQGGTAATSAATALTNLGAEATANKNANNGYVGRNGYNIAVLDQSDGSHGTSMIYATLTAQRNWLLQDRQGVLADDTDLATKANKDGSNINADFAISTSSSGVTRTLSVANSSNTASSSALVKASVAGTSAGDAYFQCAISGGQAWSFGEDNSDSDAFVLSGSSSLGTTNVLRVDTAGNVTKPLSTNFFTYFNSAATDVTGDNTTYTMAWGSSLWDYGSNISTTTFTGTTTAKYFHQINFGLSGLLSSHTALIVNFVTSNRTYQVFAASPWAISNASGNILISCSVVADFDANDTATWTINISGGTKVVDVLGLTGSTQRSWWTGNIAG